MALEDNNWLYAMLLTNIADTEGWFSLEIDMPSKNAVNDFVKQCENRIGQKGIDFSIPTSEIDHIMYGKIKLLIRDEQKYKLAKLWV
jgi:hypothetical protein